MSVQQLPRLREPVADRAGLGAVLDAVREARLAVEAAAALPGTGLGADEIADAVAAVAVLESKVAALRLALLAEADTRHVAASTGATGTDAWAAALTGSTRAVLAGGIWLARMLSEKYAVTREAFADGAINEAQARVIVSAAEQLPAEVAPGHRTAAEAALVVKAVAGADARRLRQAARRMLDVATLEVSAERVRRLADEHEAVQLAREEARAEVETWLSLGDNGDGTFSGRFTIPELHGHLLRAALEQLTAPVRLARNRAGSPVLDETVSSASGQSWTERLGQGFAELIEHLPTTETGGFARSGVGVLVHIDYQHLLDQLGSARLDTGVRLSAGQARRLACTAGLIPAVLGGPSQPLDLGREARLHTTAQRRALAIAHDTCAAEGCDRPFAWCDIHHPHAWSRGGVTSLDNALPLCGHHHRRAHDPHYDLRLLSSGQVRFRRRP